MKKLRLTKLSKNIYLFLYFFSFIVFSPLSFFNYNFELLLVLSIIQCILFSIYLFKSCNTISFIFLFWLISHFFHLSILLIPANSIFEKQLPFTTINLDDRNIFFTILYIYFCNIFFALGCIPNSNINFVISKKKKESNMNIKKIALLLLCIGLLPKLYILFKYTLLFINGSYLSVIEFIPNGILYFFSTLVDSSLLLLIITEKKIYKKRIWILLFLGLQFVLIMIGKRGVAITHLIALIIVLFTNKKISIKEILNVIIISFVILFLLGIVSQYRSFSAESRALFFKNFFSKSNPLLGTIFFTFSEFGSAFLTVCYSIMYLSQCHSLGVNYFVGFLTIVPTTSQISTLVNKITFFKDLFPFSSFLGGSFIGESYYSFSWLGIFLFFLFGFFLSSLSRIIISEVKKTKKYYIYFVVPIISNLLWWIRDYFSSLVRPVVWLIMIIIFLDFFIKYTKQNKVSL